MKGSLTMQKENLTIDYDNMMKVNVGDKGISDSELTNYGKTAVKCMHNVQASRGLAMQGWMDLPYNQTEIVKDIVNTAKNIRKNFDYFVVLGIGGSALGPIAVFNALKHLYYNELPKKVRKGPKFYVLDNVDPERMNALLDVIDVEKTMFNVITKSGATSETMSQYLIINDMLVSRLGDKASSHIIATTSMSKGNLIKLAKANNYKTYYIPDGVGGRFSELCPVGLLPAAVLNIDVKQLLNGAKVMDKLCKNKSMYENPALLLAVLQKISMDKGCNVSVMMPYADSLKYVSDWYCQLWGESLGKAVDKSGVTVNVGQTPVKALGVTDQHSQVQLYNEGPYDKVITFIATREFRSSVTIPDGCKEFSEVNFLCGHTLDKLLSTELFATRFALTSKGRMNYTITLPTVNEFYLGQLLYLFMMETAYCGELLNIDTFNQPGVEGGKNATYALFGRKGYEELAKTMRSKGDNDNKYSV